MKRLFYLAFISTVAVDMFAGVSITGARSIEVTPAASTGLSAIYVVEDAAAASIVYQSSGTDAVAWQRYSNLGGGYAEDVANVEHDGNTYTFKAESSDMGYIITDGSKQTCIWVVNYANHDYQVKSLSVTESDCDRVYLSATPGADEIVYYTITGRREVLDRGITLSYNTLEYSEDDEVYNSVEVSRDLESLSSTISVDAPFCDTDFQLSPDRFQREWGFGETVTSASFTATAVEARTSASQTVRESENEQQVETDGLGGSAPCEVEFKAAVTDAAIYRKWEVSTSADFENVLYSYDSLDFTFTFTDAGSTYVRFVANNSAGSCEYVGDVYTVSIGESRLDCPNAFSPGASEGVNDEWRVSYRSIVAFECNIFNRHGHKLCTLTDPSQGWDGKTGGKVVPSGVYFYVINARGADGKVYKLSGDINVINSRTGTQSSATVE